MSRKRKLQKPSTATSFASNSAFMDNVGEIRKPDYVYSFLIWFSTVHFRVHINFSIVKLFDSLWRDSIYDKYISIITR